MTAKSSSSKAKAAPKTKKAKLEAEGDDALDSEETMSSGELPSESEEENCDKAKGDARGCG